MKRFVAVILAIQLFLAVGALAQGPGAPNSGSQLSLSGSTGSYTFSWWGVGGYTYLIESSDDLINWSYLPVVESGSDAVIQWGFTSSSPSLFTKLEYITLPAAQLTGTGLNGPVDSSSGLPGDWELFYYGQLGVDPTSFVGWSGSQVTILQAYQNGWNPKDYYSGETPELTVVSGTGQNGTPGTWLANPVTVQVTGTDGLPLVSAPVVFSVASGGGLLALGEVGYTLSSSVTALTDYSGSATAFVQLPTTPNGTMTISVGAGPSSGTATVSFSATVNDTPPAAPTNVVEVDNADGSIDLSWTESSTNVTSFPIRVRDQYGNWQIIGSVPATQTSVHINPNHTLAQ